MPQFQTYRGDTGRELEATLYKPSGIVFDLTGCTVQLLLVSARNLAVVYTRTAAKRNSPGTDGLVYYAFQTSDFTGGAAIPSGKYYLRWKVTDGASKPVTIGNDRQTEELLMAEVLT